MAPRKPCILVADDDAGLLRLVERTLELQGYSISTAKDGHLALVKAINEEPDLVMLDVVMPGLDGFEVCRRLRMESNIPIIMLTAKSGATDKVTGLELGADDYITKPFDQEELAARVKAVLRRSSTFQNLSQRRVVSGPLVVDFHRNQVALDGHTVALTATESRLLFLMAGNVGRVLTHGYLLDEIWGGEYLEERHLLQVTMARLRQKIGDDPRSPKYIATRAGIGYMFIDQG